MSDLTGGAGVSEVWVSEDGKAKVEMRPPEGQACSSGLALERTLQAARAPKGWGR